jgi:hypothetical protein
MMLGFLVHAPRPPSTSSECQTDTSHYPQVFGITSYRPQWHVREGTGLDGLSERHVGVQSASQTINLYRTISSVFIIIHRKAWKCL